MLSESQLRFARSGTMLCSLASLGDLLWKNDSEETWEMVFSWDENDQ